MILLKNNLMVGILSLRCRLGGLKNLSPKQELLTTPSGSYDVVTKTPAAAAKKRVSAKTNLDISSAEMAKNRYSIQIGYERQS
jgi:hypothetical protein